MGLRNSLPRKAAIEATRQIDTRNTMGLARSAELSQG
jgi:hypothetical protein